MLHHRDILTDCHNCAGYSCKQYKCVTVIRSNLGTVAAYVRPIMVCIDHSYTDFKNDQGIFAESLECVKFVFHPYWIPCYVHLVYYVAFIFRVMFGRPRMESNRHHIVFAYIHPFVAYAVLHRSLTGISPKATIETSQTKVQKCKK